MSSLLLAISLISFIVKSSSAISVSLHYYIIAYYYILSQKLNTHNFRTFRIFSLIEFLNLRYRINQKKYWVKKTICNRHFIDFHFSPFILPEAPFYANTDNRRDCFFPISE